MDGEFQKRNGEIQLRGSMLLELAASDDLLAFKTEVEGHGCDVDKAELWYGRRIGSKKMGFEERTPLMIASMFGSTEVLKFIIGIHKCDINRVCGSDKVTAIHCAVAGGSGTSVEVVRLLLDASAEPNSIDGNGNRPVDVIPHGFRSNCHSRKKSMEFLLQGHYSDSDGEGKVNSKKEYPVDIVLPDINNAMFSSDEFRMFTFKVKPCSRAYSHDWTECPFVHPGENARRRDPRQYPYSCVPCPEFRKGSCHKADSCEYAHGVFESWLHPAQYRTRLCKDETGCARKVCFFAHKVEELRPVYASTGSAIPSPKSPTSTPPMSPLAASASSSSPKGMNLWQSKVKISPPALQLSGSRLKTALCARDLDMELMEEISRLSSPTFYPRSEPTNLEDFFGSLNSTQMLSPSGRQIRPNVNQLRSSYPTSNNNIPSSPVRKPTPFGFDSSSAVAAAVMNSRSAATTKRSQSFIDRGVSNFQGNSISAPIRPSSLSEWGSPGGKLDWGVQADELNKFRRSASFGFRSNSRPIATTNAVLSGQRFEEPDVSWVNSLVKDGNHADVGAFRAEVNHGKGMREMYSPWVEQLYIEPERMAA